MLRGLHGSLRLQNIPFIIYILYIGNVYKYQAKIIFRAMFFHRKKGCVMKNFAIVWMAAKYFLRSHCGYIKIY